MLQMCYGDHAIAKKQVNEWYKRFQSGCDAVENRTRSGRPSTSTNVRNVEKITKLLAENSKLTIREIVDEANISFGSIQSIVRDGLGLRRVASRLVPKELNFLQKIQRVEVSKVMLSMVDSDQKFIKAIFTGGQTWLFQYDTKARYQASECHAGDEPKPKKPCQF